MGHRIPAQGANPGNPPGKRDLRSEGTPHSLRVSDIDHGLPSGVPSEHTYSRGCGSQGVALGWYALPLQGMWYDHSFRYRESRSHALTGHHIPAQGANPGNLPGKRDQRSEGTPHSLRVSDIDHVPPYAVFLQNTLILGNAVPRALPWAGMRYPFRVCGTIMFPIPEPRSHALMGYRIAYRWVGVAPLV